MRTRHASRECRRAWERGVPSTLINSPLYSSRSSGIDCARTVARMTGKNGHQQIWTPIHGINFASSRDMSTIDDAQEQQTGQTWLYRAAQYMPSIPFLSARSGQQDASGSSRPPALTTASSGNGFVAARQYSNRPGPSSWRSLSTTVIPRQQSDTSEYEQSEDDDDSRSMTTNSESHPDSNFSDGIDHDTKYHMPTDPSISSPGVVTHLDVKSGAMEEAADVLSDATVLLEGLQLDKDSNDATRADDKNPRAFKIPDTVMKHALAASDDSEDRFWTFRKYRDAEGKSPTVHYCKDFETAEDIAAKFLYEPVLGFDLEWEVLNSTPSTDNIKRAVSVVQLASESRIAIFHLALFEGDTPDQLLPPTLRKILLSPDQVKAGVNVVGDVRRVRQCFDIEMQGVFELSHLYKQVTFGAKQPWMVNRVLVSLAAQVKGILGLPLAKGEVRVSMWSKKLAIAQTDYAASDAYAGFQLYHALDDQRLQMNHVPPRPALYELGQPIPLPDSGLSDDESSSETDSDASQLSTESKPATRRSRQPVPEDDSSVQPDDGDLRIEDDKTTAEEKPVQPVPRLPRPEFEKANDWASSFRASLGERERKLIGDSELRAYHIWHAQEHDLTTTAGIMRTPPLALSTVAGYVCRSVYHCNLPANVDRLEQVSNHLTIYDKRYGKVVAIARLNEYSSHVS